MLYHFTRHQPDTFQLLHKVLPPAAHGAAGDIGVVPFNERQLVIHHLGGQLAHVVGAGHMVHKGLGVLAPHYQLYPDPVALHALLQGLVIDAHTEV